VIRLQEGDVETASRLFQKALEQGASAEAHYGRGIIAEREGDLDSASARFREALSLNSSHEAAKRRLLEIDKSNKK
jgi:Tfp pilus assembly protein PilF